ncbi:MAG TPA: hypothetical protein VLG91_20290 [Streptomyces sp.]|nr:hypothetical protein [Streptomyces sp.]
MSEKEPYPWIRRDDETEHAYANFQSYLRMGTGRTLAKAAQKIGKTTQALGEFSRKHDWVERCRAYDRHIMTAETDGLAHQIAEARDENLELIRKLRNHLSDRLDEFVEKKQDPSVRWTQALMAMAKLEMNAFTVRDDSKTSERIERIEALVERVIGMEADAE